MALLVHNLKLGLDEPEDYLVDMAAKKLRMDPDGVRTLRIARRSLDARPKHIGWVYSVIVEIAGRESEILKRTHGVDVKVGKPQVAYRETISTRVEDSYIHKKQTGGSGQFARIDYIVEPGEEGSGFVFESKITGGNVPREFWPAVEKGFKTSMNEGVLAGFPVLDVKITLTDGAAHSVDSSAIAFEIAAKAAYRQSIPKATPKLLEPIMKVDVFTPEDQVGDVIGDLNRRRATIKSQEAGTTGIRVKADAPLSEMFGYIGDLRTITSGRGQFSMEFSHYSTCPASVAEKVVAEAQERKIAA